MKQIKFFLVILCFSLLLTACTSQKPNTPLTVAQAFWTAALDGDVETAMQYLTPQSRPNFKVILKNKKDYIELSEQNITALRAEILTQLTRHEGNQQHKTALRTILLNQQGQWLVDFDQTRDSMLGSELQSVIDKLSKTMQETIDKGIRVMGESVKEELKVIEDNLQNTLQELDKELEKQQKEQQKSQSAPESTTL